MSKVLMVLAVLSLPYAVSADTISVPGDYSAISLALANADSGDVVAVTGGPYLEWDLVIPPGVSVVAPGYAGVEINALHQGAHFGINGEDASYVIEGFKLTARVSQIVRPEPACL